LTPPPGCCWPRKSCTAVPCQYDFLPEDRPTDALFLLSGEDVPLDSCLWEGAAEKAAELAARSVILARDPALLSRHGLGPGNSRFICATPPGTLPPFVEEEGELTAFLREEGEFLAFREYGYREKRFGQVRAVILRSSSGQAAALTQCTGTTYLRNAGKGGTGGGKCGKGPILGGFAAGRPRYKGGMSQLF